MKGIIAIVFFLIITVNYSKTYSVAGIGTREEMSYMVDELNINTFQIDVPWREYHLDSTVVRGEVVNKFKSLEELDKTLNLIKGIGGKAIIQLSPHYVPPWFVEKFSDSLLSTYLGEYEIQKRDITKHILPTPYDNNIKYKIIGAWYDYMARYLSENHLDVIEYINAGILEEGQMSYPWSGYDDEELAFWAFDKYAIEEYKKYINNKFSKGNWDKEVSLEKLGRVNLVYDTRFKSWDEVRPPYTYEESKGYKAEYLRDFLAFYGEGLLSISKVYSDILIQYFPREKLVVKIPHWHRGVKNKRTLAEGRFTNYYIDDLAEYYGAIIFLPVQDPIHLSSYIKKAKKRGYKVILEPTFKIGDYQELDEVIESGCIDGINAVNILDFYQSKELQGYYRKWIDRLEKNPK